MLCWLYLGQPAEISAFVLTDRPSLRCLMGEHPPSDPSNPALVEAKANICPSLGSDSQSMTLLQHCDQHLQRHTSILPGCVKGSQLVSREELCPPPPHLLHLFVLCIPPVSLFSKIASKSKQKNNTLFWTAGDRGGFFSNLFSDILSVFTARNYFKTFLHSVGVGDLLLLFSLWPQIIFDSSQAMCPRRPTNKNICLSVQELLSYSDSCSE